MSLRFEVLSSYRLNRRTIVLCRCECGNEFTTRQDSLKRGDTTSCGCYRRKRLSAARLGVPPAIMTHGEAARPRSKEYTAWSHMKTRCFNAATKDWKDYGGRGIKVCERWMKYENFLSDMGRRPEGRYSLDRIDVNGNYEPTNCRWATDHEQANNKRKYKSLFQVN